jgi:hypothetical protein
MRKAAASQRLFCEFLVGAAGVDVSMHVRLGVLALVLPPVSVVVDDGADGVAVGD